MSWRRWLSFVWPQSYRSRQFIIRSWGASVNEPLKQRLTTMGLLPGQRVELLTSQAPQDPMRGAHVLLRLGSTSVVSLRPSEWAALRVEEVVPPAAEKGT
jgi:Fe2+ transport system protein FeoA